jgi:hypothetical protein
MMQRLMFCSQLGQHAIKIRKTEGDKLFVSSTQNIQQHKTKIKTKK